MLKAISKKAVKKFLDMVGDLQKDEEKFRKFWNKYGKNMKYGIVSDEPNQQKLLKLAWFKTSKEQGEYTTLKAYMERNPDVNHFYFMGGKNYQEIMDSPMIQKLKQKNIEVLVFDEPIDEYMASYLSQYEGRTFSNVAKSDFKIPQTEEDKLRFKALKKAFKPLTKYISGVYPDLFASVNISQRLVEDPFAVLATQYGSTAHMEKVFQYQANHIRTLEKSKQKVLEINPDHTLVQKMLEMAQAED